MKPEGQRRMFVTKNREYHARDNKIVAVRDRRSGAFDRTHRALAGCIAGMIRGSGELRFLFSLDAVEPGDSLCIVVRNNGLVTSRIERIDLPPEEARSFYLDD